MSKGPENTFIAGVHRHLPTGLYRMKNHNVYNGGVADVWYSGPASDLWVEYKFIALPKRDDTLIDLCSGRTPALSHIQQEWLSSRLAEGRPVAVIVGCKEGGVWFSNTGWTEPVRTGDFKKSLYNRETLARCISDFTGVS